MPLFKTSTEWFEQSSLLLKARPTTARITSKYTVLAPTPSKIQKRKKYLAKRSQSTSTTPAPSNPSEGALSNPEDAIATFTLKTYDPVSGACLKYETNKAAEVGRLIGSLGRLGRHMAALPDAVEDLNAAADASGIATPVVEKGDAGLGEVKAPGAGGAGGKKKKKGKK